MKCIKSINNEITVKTVLCDLLRWYHTLQGDNSVERFDHNL